MKIDRGPKVRRGGGDREKAILVGLKLPGDPVSYQKPLDELERLADTAGADTVDKIVQSRDRPDAKTYIGKGKAEEIGELLVATGADLVIVDHDLSPSQARNLEKVIKGRVIDRTELILDIFVRRASSAMAKAQVELAQMQYSLPRLKRLWTHLNREVAGGRVGIGVRGPGEKQIETDRRLVRRRIRDLQRGLKEMQKHRVLQTKARDKFFTICLVGYTNAGKSTLLRALTGADVFIQDRLFATLDTTTRAWEIAPGRKVFLSDTIGFIRDLPHHLVSSFLATLEEARRADLLLHVVDVADPDALEHVDVVQEALYSIGASAVPRITVLNKIDRQRDPVTLRLLEEQRASCVRTSAQTGRGIDELRDAVYGYVTRHHVNLTLSVSAGRGKLLTQIREWAEVDAIRYDGDDAILDVRIDRPHARRLQEMGVRVLEGAEQIALSE